jgi:hypothetical protein
MLAEALAAPRALDAATTISDDRCRAETLTGLAPHLPADQLPAPWTPLLLATLRRRPQY